MVDGVALHWEFRNNQKKAPAMIEKTAPIPEEFSIIIKSRTAHIERNLKFGKDEVSFKVGVSLKDNPDMGVIQLHRASLQTVLAHLQDLLAKTDLKNPQP